jgi:hypothetical protein
VAARARPLAPLRAVRHAPRRLLRHVGAGLPPGLRPRLHHRANQEARRRRQDPAACRGLAPPRNVAALLPLLVAGAGPVTRAMKQPHPPPASRLARCGRAPRACPGGHQRALRTLSLLRSHAPPRRSPGSCRLQL